MISVYVTYIAMQVVMPLHTPQVHTHKFTVGYMVSTFSGGELFAVEHHRMSTLCKLSTHRDNICISGYIKWLAEVGQRQNWRCSQLQLQQFKRLLLSIAPDKFTCARQQVQDRCSNTCKRLYEPVVVVCKAQELLYTLDVLRWLPFQNGSYLVLIHAKFTRTNNVTKVLYIGLSEFTFLQLGLQLMLT